MGVFPGPPRIGQCWALFSCDLFLPVGYNLPPGKDVPEYNRAQLYPQDKVVPVGSNMTFCCIVPDGKKFGSIRDSSGKLPFTRISRRSYVSVRTNQPASSSSGTNVICLYQSTELADGAVVFVGCEYIFQCYLLSCVFVIQLVDCASNSSYPSLSPLQCFWFSVIPNSVVSHTRTNFIRLILMGQVPKNYGKWTGQGHRFEYGSKAMSLPILISGLIWSLPILKPDFLHLLIVFFESSTNADPLNLGVVGVFQHLSCLKMSQKGS